MSESFTLGAYLSLMVPVCRALGCTICSTVDVFNFNQSWLGIIAVKPLAAHTSLQLNTPILHPASFAGTSGPFWGDS